MNRGLPPRIAWRYLFSKKSHSAVSAISAVSVVGVAVATAALVCVLSVFNGFREVLGDKLDILTPDVLVEPAAGKTISAPQTLLTRIRAEKGVAAASPVVADNALAVYDSREMPVKVRGVVPGQYASQKALAGVILEGGKLSLESDTLLGPEDEYGLRQQELRGRCAASVGVASRLRIFDMGSPMLLFTPRREGRLNPANPLNSFIRDSVAVEGVFQTRQNDFDDDLIVTDIAIARHLFGYTDEATAIEVTAAPGTDGAKLATRLQKHLGPGYTVKDRLRQQEVNFRMIAIEKWVTFLLLFFILLIAGFNLISALAMLVLEKRSSLATLHSLGLTRRAIGSVFAWESLFVTLLGGLSGILLGVALCLLQQHFGIIRLNGDESTLVISAYPVALEWLDILVVLAPVAVVGALTAWITAAFARQRVA